MAGSFLLFLASLVSCLFLFPVAVSEDALTELPSAAEGIISGAADPLTKPESSATAPAEVPVYHVEPESAEIVLYPVTYPIPDVDPSPFAAYPPLSELKPEATADMSLWINVPAGYSLPYYVRINVLSNVVNVYSYAGDSLYRPYTAFLTSTGTYTLHEGVFALSDKYEWRELYGGEYGHYASRIYSGLLFHSCPCFQPDVNTVDTEAYRALGTPASLGCMRLRDIDARWIYENCASGTLVEFYDSENPGPFGKPEIQPLPEGAVKDPTAQ